MPWNKGGIVSSHILAASTNLHLIRNVSFGLYVWLIVLWSSVVNQTVDRLIHILIQILNPKWKVMEKCKGGIVSGHILAASTNLHFIHYVFTWIVQRIWIKMWRWKSSSIFRLHILAKKVCSRELTNKGKKRFVKSFTKKKIQKVERNWRNGGCFSKVGQSWITCAFDFIAT